MSVYYIYCTSDLVDPQLMSSGISTGQYSYFSCTTIVTHIYLGYPQCCVTISLTLSSSYSLIVHILLWLQHCVHLTIDTSSTSLPLQRAIIPISLLSPHTRVCWTCR